MRKVLLLPACAFALAAAGCGGGGDGGAEVSKDVPVDAVALVGGEKILKAEFDRLLAQAEKSFEAQQREFPKAGTPEYETLKNQAVAYLVQRAQFRQEATAMGIKVTDAEVEKRLGELKTQFFGGDEERYQAQLEELGLTEKQVLEDVRAQILSEKIFEAVTKDVKVTDKNVENYYNENEAQFTQPAARDVRHILVQRKVKARELYEQIKGGADFAALAKKFSQDPGSKDQGGRLAVRQGETVPPFDKFVFSAKTGELSRPIRTQFGWHLIEVLSAIKPETVTPLEEIRESIRQQLVQQKRNEAMTNWVERVRKKYADKVAYAVGYAPPAATQAEPGGTTAAR